MTELNKVDTRVKASMLKYPGIFPSRMDVLAHVFMVNGSGFHFDPSTGVVTDGEEPVVPEGMNYPDAPSRHVTESSQLRHAYEMQKLGFIEQNIDVLCRKNADYLSSDRVRSLVGTFYEQGGVLASIEKFLDAGNSAENLDDDWRQALKEFCTWFTFQCTRENYVDGMSERPMPDGKVVMPAYQMCKRLFKKCQTKQDHDLQAKRAEIAKDIAERIKQKAGDDRDGE